MAAEAIPRRMIDDARACWLMGEDGSKWRVVDVVFDDGVAWIQARATEEMDQDDSGPRILETVLTGGAWLVWELADGGRVRLDGGPVGQLEWSVEREGGGNSDVLNNEYLAS